MNNFFSRKSKADQFDEKELRPIFRGYTNERLHAVAENIIDQLEGKIPQPNEPDALSLYELHRISMVVQKELMARMQYLRVKMGLALKKEMDVLLFRAGIRR